MRCDFLVDNAKLPGVNHFLELIAEFNSPEYLKEAHAKEERTDTVGVPHDMAEEENESDESDDEE